MEQKSEEEIEAIGLWAAYMILEESIKPTLERMGIKFDNFFYESDLYKE